MNRVNKKIEAVLDEICHHGCAHVRECITKIQSHKVVTEVKSINPMEQQIVLQELISIMEIYDMQTK